MARILIVVDYRGAFWSSTKNMTTLTTLDVVALQRRLIELGHSVEVTEFARLDLSDGALRGSYVVYTSSEDAGARYKRFIEGRVFGLRLAGATVIPEPELLLAHHDKAAMEAVRATLLKGTPGQLASRTFGTLEEFKRLFQGHSGAVVLKPSAGAGSQGVTLAQTPKEIRRAARRLTKSFDFSEGILELARRIHHARRAHNSLHRSAIVTQEFLSGLRGDYKVLRYGRRYYVLERQNRENDFRASGGGRLDYEPQLRVDVIPILDAAAVWSNAIGSPFASLDIAYDPASGIQPHLIEFQCVHFGPATAENSTGYYIQEGGQWSRRSEICDLEGIFAEATSDHIAGQELKRN